MLALMTKAIDLAKQNGDDITVNTGTSTIVNYLYRKGSNLRDRGDHKEAIQWLEKSLKYKMSSIQKSMVGFELGMACKAAKNSDKACKYFSMAREGHLSGVVKEQMKYLGCN